MNIIGVYVTIMLRLTESLAGLNAEKNAKIIAA